MSDLTELLERVRSATGADRELDEYIFEHFDPSFPTDAFKLSGHSPGLVGSFGTGAYTSVKAPTYSASIDASLALVERKLPGWGKEIMLPCGDEYASCRMWLPPPNDGPESLWRKSSGKAGTTPLAILAALLSALSEIEKL